MSPEQLALMVRSMGETVVLLSGTVESAVKRAEQQAMQHAIAQASMRKDLDEALQLVRTTQGDVQRIVAEAVAKGTEQGQQFATEAAQQAAQGVREALGEALAAIGADSLREGLAQATEKLGIIGDNLAQTSKDVESLRTSAFEANSTAAKTFGELQHSITELNTSTAGRFDELAERSTAEQQRVTKVEQAVEAQKSATDEQLQAARQELTEMISKQASDAGTALSKAVVEINGSIESVANTAADQIKAADTKIRADMDVVFGEETNRTKLEVKADSAVLREEMSSLYTTTAENFVRINGEIESVRESLVEKHAALAESVRSAAQRETANTETVLQRIGEVEQLVRSTDEARGQTTAAALTEVRELVGTVEKSVAVVEKSVTDRVTIKSFNEAGEAVGTEIKNVYDRITATDEARGQTTAAALTEVRGYVNQTEQSVEIVRELIGHLDKSVGERATVENVTQLRETVSDQINETKELIRTTDEARGQTTAAALVEVRELVGTVEKVATDSAAASEKSLQALGEQVEATRSEMSEKWVQTVANVRELNEGLSEDVQTKLQATSDRVEETQRALGELSTTVQSKASADELATHVQTTEREITALHTHVAEKVSGVIAQTNELLERAVQAAESKFATVQDVSGMATAGDVQILRETGATVQQLEQVREALQTQVQSTAEQFVNTAAQINEVRETTEKALSEVETKFAEKLQPLATLESVHTLRANSTEAVVQLTASFNERLEQLDSKATESITAVAVQVREEIKGAVESTGRAHAQLVQDVAERGVQLAQTVDEKAAHVDQAVEKAVQAAQQATHATTQAFEQSQAQAAQTVAELRATFSQQVSEVQQSTTTEFAKHAEAMRDQLDNAIAERVTKAHAAAIGEVGEFVKANMPNFSIDAQADEEQFVLTFTVGDTAKTVTIPVKMGVDYKGVFNDKAKYTSGDMVTAEGGLWSCKGNVIPGRAPNKDPNGWQLAVKQGKPGVNGRSPKVYKHHSEGNTYMQGDFLRHNNRLWQCAADGVNTVPPLTEIHSTNSWTCLGVTQ